MRAVIAACLLAVAAQATTVEAQPPATRGWKTSPSVTVVAAPGDPRIALTREAVDFWNGILVDMLSEGTFVSFTARAFPPHRVVIGIRTQRTPPMTLPNVARNVIAHEIGHAIGLGHNDDPEMLMCGRPAPRRPDAFFSRTARFFRLTASEKTLVQTMYPTTWKPDP